MASKEEPKEYEIKTVAELVEAAKESGDIETLIADLKMFLEVFTGKRKNEGLAKVAKLSGIDYDDLFKAMVTPSVFQWTDDHKAGLTATHISIKFVIDGEKKEKADE